MSELDKTESGEQKQTTVEEGTQFKGTLQSTCRVVVRGVVDGELEAPSVHVSATGAVTGSVKAQTLQSSGVLAGRVDVDELILSGTVRNDTVIRAKSLDVKLQSDSKVEVKFGECVLEIGDDPQAEQAETAEGKSALKKDKASGNHARRPELSAAIDPSSKAAVAAPAAESAPQSDSSSNAST